MHCVTPEPCQLNSAIIEHIMFMRKCLTVRGAKVQRQQGMGAGAGVGQ